MPFQERLPGKLPSPGPYLAEITNHLDPDYMGSVEVVLTKGLTNSINIQANAYPVRYLNPFYGVTSVRNEGTNSGDFNDVQKSYGMWMVPPDIGTTVMVIFIDGDPNQGFWMGCVQDKFQNHMVPGIAASHQTEITEEQRRKYGTDYLPVGEFLKATKDLNNPNVNSYKKPVHPFADRLLAQGLLLDTVRGVTSSSARRETPSGVFGISTPGPLDTSNGAKRGKIGYTGNRRAPVSRLGGSSFVMDDGDINGQNELVRLRTRTGHQILMHNSQDLIYIANASGTAWIEMTSAGKLDIYAADSVSIHTEADFNFRADRDINLEAKRNINIRAMQNMETNVAGHHFLTVDDKSMISIKGSKDENIGDTFKLSVGQDFNLSASQNIKATSGQDMNLAAAGVMKQGANGNFNVSAGGNYLETATQIHMNGPTAAQPNTADTADHPPLLPTYSLPNRSASAGWADGNLFAAGKISSIMQRVPTHEPYDQHENISPASFSSFNTDAGLQSRASSGVADNPGVGTLAPANSPEVVPGTCDPTYAKDINASSAQAGIQQLKSACTALGLTSPYAVASLLGIAGGESRWQTTTENFNYTAARLLQVFPSRFKGDATLAQQYAGNPNNSLPEFLYGPSSSVGAQLGNVNAGDGAKFIGRGYIQITGRSNYTKYSNLLYSKGLVSSATALIDNPSLASDPKISAEISVLYMLDRVKLAQTDPGYFNAALRAVGNNTPDITATKTGFYNCFLSQLQGTTVGTGSNGILTDSSGNPVKTGIPSV
jgi:predicted chitinase